MTDISPFKIQQQYTPHVNEIVRNPVNFATKVFALTSHARKTVGDDLSDILQSKALSSLVAVMNNAFMRLSPKVLPAPAVLDMLEKVYGEEGPFRELSYGQAYISESASSWIAAEYYLAMNDVEGNYGIDPQNTKRVITFIAFEGKKHWTSLQTALSDIDECRGSSLLASVPDLLESMHEVTSGTSRGADIQKRGGLERVKGVGADLDKVCQAILTDIRTTGENEAGFPRVYTFVKAAVEDLEASGRISHAEANNRYTALLEGLLHTQSRPKNHRHNCWSPIADDLSKFAHKDLELEPLIHLARLSSRDVIANLGIDLEAKGGLARFKSLLEKKVQPSEQYEVIEKLGLKSQFSRQELLQFSGKRITGDLGL